MKGVLRTRVGYAGGTKPNPTYHSLGDHTETVEIDFDPSQISYGKLLEVFWNSHNPGQRTYSRQYMAAVFYHDAEQKRLAEETRDRKAKALGGQIHTQILPATHFSLAEDYHQKYRLKLDAQLMDDLTAYYPDPMGFVNSTATARINGYLDGYGNPEELEAELPGLGLTSEGAKHLKEVRSGSKRGCALF